MNLRRILLGLVLLLMAEAASAQALPGPGEAPCWSCEAVESFYEAREGVRAWTGPGAERLYDDLVLAIEPAETHGLRPQDYHLDRLRAGDPTQVDRALDRWATDAYLTLAADLQTGRIDPLQVEPAWTARRSAGDLPAYLERAVASGEIAGSLEALAPPHREYAELREALGLYRLLAETDFDLALKRAR